MQGGSGDKGGYMDGDIDIDELEVKVAEPRRTWRDWFLDETVRRFLEEFGGVEFGDLEDRGLGLSIGFFYASSFAVCFAMLVWVNTTNLMGTKFLSVVGNTTQQNCQFIPTAVHGSFEGSYTGLWNTNPLFNTNQSLFVLQMAGTNATNDQYTAAMTRFSKDLAALGQKGKNRSLAWSAVAFSTYVFQDTDLNMKLYSSSEAGVIFSGPVYLAAFSSRSGICQENKVVFSNKSFDGGYTTAAYNQGSRKVKVSMPIVVPSDWLSSVQSSTFTSLKETCPLQFIGVMDQSNFDPFLPGNRGGRTDFDFDMRTVALAVSLNLGIINTTRLLRIDSLALRFNNVTGWIDPTASPEMDPVYCLDKKNAFFKLTAAQVSGPEVCFLNIGLFYWFYPVLTQMANTLGRMTQKTCTGKFGKNRYPCSCPSAASPPWYFCQAQDFYVSFLMDQGGRSAQTFSTQQYTTVQTSYSSRLVPPWRLGLAFQNYLIKDPANGDITAMNAVGEILAYTAVIFDDMVDADVVQSSSTDCKKKYNGWDLAGYTLNQKLQGAWDALCPWKTCSALIVRQRDDDMLNHLVLPLNKYGVQFSALTNKTFPNEGYGLGYITQRACNDMLSQSEGMALLSATPPVPLVQPFYQCTYSLQAALINAIGSSSAFANLIVTVGMACLGFFFIKLINKRSKEPLLSRKKKEDILMSTNRLLISGLVKEIEQHRLMLLKLLPKSSLASDKGRSRWNRTTLRYGVLKKLNRKVNDDLGITILKKDDANEASSKAVGAGSSNGSGLSTQQSPARRANSDSDSDSDSDQGISLSGWGVDSDSDSDSDVEKEYGEAKAQGARDRPSLRGMSVALDLAKRPGRLPLNTHQPQSQHRPQHQHRHQLQLQDDEEDEEEYWLETTEEADSDAFSCLPRVALPTIMATPRPKPLTEL